MTNCIFFTGQSVRNSKNDILQAITLGELYQAISRPSSALEELVRRLRVMYTIDKQKYSETKTLLPYFIPAHFRQGIRHTANFESIQGFVLDLDDLPSNGLDPDQVFTSLQQDPRVALLFRSPGGYGLKLVFQLSEPLHDTRTFSDFYKAFSLRFARQYQLEKVMDFKTSDACRVCFLSADHKAWFNATAQAVSVADYVIPVSGLTDETPDSLAAADTTITKQANSTEAGLAPVKQDIPKEVMTEISRLLSPGTKSIRQRQPVYVPPRLERLEVALGDLLQKHDIVIASCRDIQYGKQIHFVSGGSFAEINVFYGKKGYSLVKTTRSGSAPDLCEKVLQLLASLLVYRPIGDALVTT